jgi:hypothetical protein
MPEKNSTSKKELTKKSLTLYLELSKMETKRYKRLPYGNSDLKRQLFCLQVKTNAGFYMSNLDLEQ